MPQFSVGVCHCSHFVMYRMTTVWIVFQKIKTMWEPVLSLTLDQDIIHNTRCIAFATSLFMTFSKWWENLIAIHHQITLIFSLSRLPHMAFLPEIYKYYINYCNEKLTFWLYVEVWMFWHAQTGSSQTTTVCFCHRTFWLHHTCKKVCVQGVNDLY